MFETIGILNFLKMAISELMTLVLQKLNLIEEVNKFSEQKISPDIVCLLSSHELQELGITNRGDMVKLRNECIRYGADQPRKLKDVYGPPKFQIPKQLFVTLINEGFCVPILRTCSLFQKGNYITECKNSIFQNAIFHKQMMSSTITFKM